MVISGQQCILAPFDACAVPELPGLIHLAADEFIKQFTTGKYSHSDVGWMVASWVIHGVAKRALITKINGPNFVRDTHFRTGEIHIFRTGPVGTVYVERIVCDIAFIAPIPACSNRRRISVWLRPPTVTSELVFK